LVDINGTRWTGDPFARKKVLYSEGREPLVPGPRRVRRIWGRHGGRERKNAA
jgi:hypothetical protein